ncbi:MAG: 5-formyltetrahydrofolate cyclo-ligase [Legionella sp.]|nr:5-formyltetrahydrofolate cyclo-ligase [Legionella sp.]
MTFADDTMMRNRIKNKRAKLSLAQQNLESLKVCTKISQMQCYKEANNIAYYQATFGEIHLESLWESAHAQGKICYFPAIKADKTLLFLPATPTTPFKPNRFGIMEPDLSPDCAIELKYLHLMMVPLVAFDAHCNRLGMGGGSYDRTLYQQKTGFLLGVAYPFQQVEKISPHSWDIPMDAVVTSEAIYNRLG